ncbi:Exocyst complex component EXO84B [Zea mays]|uniref:Exocyst complex component EXO84B n=1 Tax=Zea mays TaxID=4577 RepID=A0A1D6LF16_MAIZE|nr:Exocyst complex component EXO84B [Zea mays]
MDGERATRRAYVDASAPPYANRRSPGCSTPAMSCFSPIHHSTRCGTGCRISIGTTNNQCSVLSLDFHPLSRRLTTAGVDHDVKVVKLEEIGGNDGSDAENVCYLRDIADADKLVRVMRHVLLAPTPWSSSADT